MTEQEYTPQHVAEPREAGRPGRRADRRRGFGTASALTVVSAVVPGLGLAGTRWRNFGLTLTAVAVGVALVGAGAFFFARGWLLSVVANPTWLLIMAIALAVFGVLWAVAVTATQVLLRPQPSRWWHRLLGALLVGALTFGLAVPSAFGARSLVETSTLLRAVFQDSDDPGGASVPTFGNSSDPWANKPRLNVLILGADTGDDRTGTRTDTVMVASIDTKTGETVLFGLPRQTERLIFPAGSGLAKIWPDGYHLTGEADGEQQLSAMYQNVINYPGAAATLPASKDPGATMLKMAVGASWGLDIDYYVMANLEGFVEIVDALGGVTVNVNKPVPVGGKNPSGSDPGFPPDRWLPPGPDQHLNGYDALWFARGRYHTDDYDRMSRQRCVIKALSRQVNLTTVLANYEALTQAGRDVVATDVPNSLLPALLELAGRVRTAPLRSVSFQNGVDGFSTTRPQWSLVQQHVAAALVAQDATPVATASSTPTQSASVSPSATKGATTRRVSTSASATPSTASTSTAEAVDECAYNPAA
jgi:LCP family protein required for cell wall assembly